MPTNPLTRNAVKGLLKLNKYYAAQQVFGGYFLLVEWFFISKQMDALFYLVPLIKACHFFCAEMILLKDTHKHIYLSYGLQT